MSLRLSLQSSVAADPTNSDGRQTFDHVGPSHCSLQYWPDGGVRSLRMRILQPRHASSRASRCACDPHEHQSERTEEDVSEKSIFHGRLRVRKKMTLRPTPSKRTLQCTDPATASKNRSATAWTTSNAAMKLDLDGRRDQLTLLVRFGQAEAHVSEEGSALELRAHHSLQPRVGGGSLSRSVIAKTGALLKEEVVKGRAAQSIGKCASTNEIGRRHGGHTGLEQSKRFQPGRDTSARTKPAVDGFVSSNSTSRCAECRHGWDTICIQSFSRIRHDRWMQTDPAASGTRVQDGETHQVSPSGGWRIKHQCA